MKDTERIWSRTSAQWVRVLTASLRDTSRGFKYNALSASTHVSACRSGLVPSAATELGRFAPAFRTSLFRLGKLTLLVSLLRSKASRIRRLPPSTSGPLASRPSSPGTECALWQSFG
eukprot:scaffold69_cov248-Pinguiococcus_pyrenoidosus.AAC.34